jgi:sulfur carrier protein ThiS
MDMQTAVFRFYAELNDSIPVEKRFRPFHQRFETGATVNDALQAIGVPIAEVDLVIVNGDSVDLSHSLHPGDRVSVYPVFESLDISSFQQVRDHPLRDLRFVVDEGLEALAMRLEELGYDVLCTGLDEAIRLSNLERRVLLTRAAEGGLDGEVTRCYRPRSADPNVQVVEVVERFDLAGGRFERRLQ